MQKFHVGILGATGYVGQCFVTLLSDHPWFQVTHLVASPRSAGKTYREAVEEKWKLDRAIPENVASLRVQSIDDLDRIAPEVDLFFSAVNMEKDALARLEESIAKREVPVISNNAAHRWTPDVPLIIPEVNPAHTALIDVQKKRLGTTRGFIVAKPNCSLQSFVPPLTALSAYGPEKVFVATYQAVSGAGRRLSDWEAMQGNVIPYIGGEEEKTEQEPLKVWGTLQDGRIALAGKPVISSQCLRVPVEHGHTAAVYVKFRQPVEAPEILKKWRDFTTEVEKAGLPSAPSPFLRYFEENDRPQPALDAMAGKGMAISIGRLRKDPIFDYKFVCLSHNLIRGAAGGSVLTAELLIHQGYIQHA